MTLPVAAPVVVAVDELRIGDLLAEGGEGRVHQLPRQPHLVFKSYRRPADRSHLEDLVTWPGTLRSAEAARTVLASAAWPCSVVAGEQGRAVGLLMPRAPRRFTVRHRDGHSRLASLSYLTADPEHRALAYGLQLPHAVTPERVGLVYALARLLAAFESQDPSVGHGDLSTKNVLWSLQRGPEVFVLDCDNCDRFEADGRPVSAAGRRRAMTPNWDDPAVARGQNPGVTTDRYSLGLVFLRVVGAANFPIQARQRAAERVEIRFPVPAGRAAGGLLDRHAAVWDLCERSLSLTRAEDRPRPSAWLGPLEELLDSMGAPEIVGAVWSAQEGGQRSPVEPRSGERPGDVVVIPERAPRRERTWTRVSPSPRYGPAPGAGAPTGVGYRWAPVGPRAPRANPASAQPRVPVPPVPPGQQAPQAPRPGADPPAPRLWPELRIQLVRFGRWWLSIHRWRRLRDAVLFLVVDFVLLVLVAALVALIVSPIIQG